MFETVLVPLDGSELAEAALEPAREIGAKFGSLLVLLRVIDPISHHIAAQPPAVYDTPASAEASVELLEQVVEAERQEAMQYLEAVRGRMGGGKLEYLVVEGEARDAIIETATERQAGLIVMSSHGRGGLGRVIFGSVADHILRNSHTPILLIRLEGDQD